VLHNIDWLWQWHDKFFCVHISHTRSNYCNGKRLYDHLWACYAVQGGCNHHLPERTPKVWSDQLKATEQYFSVVQCLRGGSNCGAVYSVVQGGSNFWVVDEILKCDHSNESYWAVLSCGAVYYVVQGGSNFWVCGWNPYVWPFKWKLLSGTFLCCCLLRCTRWF